MNEELPPLLLVDDERNMRVSLESIMREEGYSMESAESAEKAITMLEEKEYFMVVTDARLGGMTGYELLAHVRERYPELPVLIITAYATPKLAVEAIKAGAIDYLAKPFAPEELLHAVARCAERYELLQENREFRDRDVQPHGLDSIIGECPSIRELRQLIRTVAPSDATVLILGESGTGKELVAGALHSLSNRSRQQYIRINCAAIPESLLESELFGHEKGSFTGAVKQKRGRVEEADGGTIFLDEIGDMSRPLQAKLLRFLEDGTFVRVGGNEELQVDVRLIAATNRDIVEAIKKNEFREDLFHRLNVVQFRPPPLRERGEDVLLLANHFLMSFCTSMNKPQLRFANAAKNVLLSHLWPGNVRELRNAVERAVILENRSEIQPSSLPDFQVESRLGSAAESVSTVLANQSLEDCLVDYERNLIGTTLKQNQFNLNKTAEQLKISRHALRYRMQRLEIHETELQAPH